MKDKLYSESEIMTKLSHTEPLFGGDDTKERYRYMQWLADTNAIKELKPVRAIPIPEGATVGDTIKAMFPDIEVMRIITVCGKSYVPVRFDGAPDNKVLLCLDWWNAQYKWEVEE